MLNLNKDEIFVIGDFNTNVRNKQSPDCKQLTNFQDLTKLTQIIKDNTRANNCFDLKFTNSDEIKEIGVLDINIREHDLIYAINKKKHTCEILTLLIKTTML